MLNYLYEKSATSLSVGYLMVLMFLRIYFHHSSPPPPPLFTVAFFTTDIVRPTIFHYTISAILNQQCDVCECMSAHGHVDVVARKTGTLR